jgi:hypothetical protein
LLRAVAEVARGAQSLLDTQEAAIADAENDHFSTLEVELLGVDSEDILKPIWD